MDGRQNVENLRENECGEGNGDDADERLFEHEQTHHHYDYSLVDWYPHPNEEGFGVHLSALAKTHVQVGIK